LELGDEAVKRLNPWRWVASTSDPFKKKSINAAKDSNGSLLNKTLVEDGGGSVEHYLIQGMKVFILLRVVKLTVLGQME
jgi:hypothetical protein